MNFRNIYKNFLFASISRFITALIGLVILGFLTRHLGQAGFGAYETILAYLFIFTVLADFGLHVVHVREISRHPENESFISSNFFTLRLILVASTVILALIVGIFLPYPPEIKKGIMVASFFVVFSSLSQVLGGIFQKYGNFYLVSISDVFSRIIQLILVVLAVKNDLGLVSFVFILSLTSIIQFLIILFMSRRLINFSLGISLSYAKKILKVSLPVAASILFTAIYIRTDTLMLSLMKPQADVGIYRLSAKLLETIVFFPALLVELTMPSFSEFAFRTKNLFWPVFKKTFNVLFVLAVPTAVYLFVLAENIAVILGGREFLASALPLKILAFVIVLVFLNNLGGKTLIALDLQKKGMRIYLFGAIVNIFLNFLVIPKYSYVGASLTTLLTEILVTAMMFSILYQKTEIQTDGRLLAKSLFAGLVMGFAIYQFKEQNILIPFFLGLFIYFPALYFLKAFAKEDLKEIFQRV